MARSLVGCRADRVLGCADLLAARHPGQRCTAHRRSPLDLRADRARPVAGPGTHRTLADAAPQRLAGGDHSLHAVDGADLERAINGLFQLGAGPLPIPLVPLALFVPLIIGLPLLLRSRRIGEVLDAMPPTWLIALQIFR